VAKGKVTKVAKGDNGGAGNMIEITHEGNVRTIYMHLNDKGIAVSVGDEVTPGKTIAKEGNTGAVRGSNGGYHLHFEIRDAKNNAVDPKLAFPYIKGQLGKSLVVS
jgi:murein DD-endopeptidase MepM/ murein hydrolase activator NlpD